MPAVAETAVAATVAEVKTVVEMVAVAKVAAAMAAAETVAEARAAVERAAAVMGAVATVVAVKVAEAKAAEVKVVAVMAAAAMAVEMVGAVTAAAATGEEVAAASKGTASCPSFARLPPRSAPLLTCSPSPLSPPSSSTGPPHHSRALPRSPKARHLTTNLRPLSSANSTRGFPQGAAMRRPPLRCKGRPAGRNPSPNASRCTFLPPLTAS